MKKLFLLSLLTLIFTAKSYSQTNQQVWTGTQEPQQQMIQYPQQRVSFKGVLLGNAGSYETCYARIRGNTFEITGKNDGNTIYGIWSKEASPADASVKAELFEKAKLLADQKICRKTILINP